MIKKKYKVGCILGTRPEVIKMAPVIFQLRQTTWAEPVIISTAQHRQLLDDMLAVFELTADYDLNIMMPNQSLGELTGHLCNKLDALIKAHRFDIILAAGDTTTVFVASLMAFYYQIPFGHIEAGLRTKNKCEPFPEEINRVLTAPLAKWHFAPTAREKENLLKENIAEQGIIITGNPVIDALYWILANKKEPDHYQHIQNFILVTAHRRENFGHNMTCICKAIKLLREKYPFVQFAIPLHPNPQAKQTIMAFLAGHDRIHLLPPLRYDEFAHMMQRSLLILTDSGGVQEEAPALSKPVLVLRNTTERPAILETGEGLLVGTDTDNIVNQVSRLLNDAVLYQEMAQGISPYGDGFAAQRIVDSLYFSLCN